MEVLFENAYLVIRYDEANGWLHLFWQGYHNSLDLKGYGRKIVEKIRLTGATRILNDSTLDQDGWGGLTCWIAREFMGQLAEAGVVAVAWVLPKNLQARTDVHKVQAQVSCPLIDTFADVEAAYNWLKTGADITDPDC